MKVVIATLFIYKQQSCYDNFWRKSKLTARDDGDPLLVVLLILWL